MKLEVHDTKYSKSLISKVDFCELTTKGTRTYLILTDLDIAQLYVDLEMWMDRRRKGK